MIPVQDLRVVMIPCALKKGSIDENALKKKRKGKGKKKIPCCPGSLLTRWAPVVGIRERRENHLKINLSPDIFSRLARRKKEKKKKVEEKRLTFLLK